jgi:hypothetical protein
LYCKWIRSKREAGARSLQQPVERKEGKELMSPIYARLYKSQIFREPVSDGDENLPSSTPDVGSTLSSAEEEASAEQEIDLEALANKICALFKQDLMLERERFGRKTSW